jgi:hypothetical protein
MNGTLHLRFPVVVPPVVRASPPRLATRDSGMRTAQCTGKERFESRALAARVARRRTIVGKPGHAYRCRHCDGYHIGSPQR